MSKKVTRVLLVEDDPNDALLLKQTVRKAGTKQFHLTHVECLRAALPHLVERNADVVLLDLSLPDSQGLATVRRVRAFAASIPLVVLIGLSDEDMATKALREGAQDYLVKGEIDGRMLLRVLRYAVERNLALFDDLTGLYNRRGFLTLAEQHLKLAYRSGKPFLVVCIDMDGLKKVNDSFGHLEGNRALAELGEVLKESFRQSDILARIGGDEFAVMMAEASEDSAEIVRKRLERKAAARTKQAKLRYKLSLSAGIACSQGGQQHSLERLLAEADARMYEDKQSKRSAARSISEPRAQEG